MSDGKRMRTLYTLLVQITNRHLGGSDGTRIDIEKKRENKLAKETEKNYERKRGAKRKNDMDENIKMKMTHVVDLHIINIQNNIQ